MSDPRASEVQTWAKARTSALTMVQLQFPPRSSSVIPPSSTAYLPRQTSKRYRVRRFAKA